MLPSSKTAQKASVSLRRRLKVKFSHSMLAIVMITCKIWITANSFSPLGFRGVVLYPNARSLFAGSILCIQIVCLYPRVADSVQLSSFNSAGTPFGSRERGPERAHLIISALYRASCVDFARNESAKCIVLVAARGRRDLAIASHVGKR